MVCREGRVHDLANRCGLRPGTRFVLLSMGGMPYTIPYQDWPVTDGIVYLIAEPVPVGRKDFVTLSSIGIDHIDILASCDAILTKPGYGTYAEAALHGRPVLYLPRSDWPEEPWLSDWLNQHVPNARVNEDDLLRGRVAEHLHALWEVAESGALPTRPRNSGAAEAADLILPYLRGAV